MLKFVPYLFLTLMFACKNSTSKEKVHERPIVQTDEDKTIIQAGQDKMIVEIDTININSDDDAKIQELTKDSKAAFFLIRHAEKAKDGTKDPPLTEKGIRRSKVLAHLLNNVNLSAVYSTNYRRTQSTADPTSKSQNINVSPFDPSDLKGFAEMLTQKYNSEHILVVGHSNSTPTLLNALHGTSEVNALDESDYNNLFLLNWLKDGRKEIISLQFDLE